MHFDLKMTENRLVCSILQPSIWLSLSHFSWETVKKVKKCIQMIFDDRRLVVSEQLVVVGKSYCPFYI